MIFWSYSDWILGIFFVLNLQYPLEIDYIIINLFIIIIVMGP